MRLGTHRAIAAFSDALLRHCRDRRSKSRYQSIVPDLVFDLKCVVFRLRPGTLANALPPASNCAPIVVEALRALIDAMVHAYRHTSIHAIRIMDSDGCLLILDTESLAALAPKPRGIRFLGTDVRWMDDSEQRALDMQFDALAATLASSDSFPGTTNQGGNVACPCLETTLQHANLTVSIPTVYGFILGYPCTYEVCSREHAAVVSRWLSSATLVLYSCRVRDVCEASDADPTLPVLLSFSVPKQLTGSEAWQARYAAWKDEMMARARCPGGVDGATGAELVFETDVCGRRGIVI